ncbi:MAG: DNA translocase FtsK 4TM domain-containing protein, partial [Verrucomicrobiota bacterium]
MARKASADSETSHGFNDIIGVALLAAALLLLVSQWSFDPNDLALHRNPPVRPAHNWIGPLGAYIANASFFVFGFAGYLLPVLLVFFALGCWFQNFFYLKRRWPWAVVLVVSSMGLLHLLDLPHLKDTASFLTKIRNAIGAPSLGGFIGMELYRDFFWMLGNVGAAIVYGTIYLISLLFLTNFQLGQWVRAAWAARSPA